MSGEREVEAGPAEDVAGPARPASGASPAAAALARLAATGHADTASLLALSRTAGNRAVARLAAPRVLARHGTVAESQKGTWIDPKTDKAYEKIRSWLERSPWGREAMDLMVRHQVKTLWASDGPPANYAQELNRVRLNNSGPNYETSAYFVHEMYHAQRFHEGKSPKASAHKDDMAKWVDVLVEEEIQGTIKGFLHKLQIERAAGAPADDKPIGAADFRRAFDVGFNRAKARGGDIDAWRKEGISNGAAMVRWLIRPGLGRPKLGASQWMSYDEFYQASWRRERNDPH